MRITKDFVFFFGSKDIYSNFFESLFVIDGIQFTCGEQWIMYQKALTFNDQEIAQQILETTNCKGIKALGRKVKNYDDTVWAGCREQKAYIGLLEKFKQNPKLKQELLATGIREIVEASPYDRIWGVGLSVNDISINDKNNWTGTNILGKILMRVREALFI